VCINIIILSHQQLPYSIINVIAVLTILRKRGHKENGKRNNSL
jgi:hypothetical protein